MANLQHFLAFALWIPILAVVVARPQDALKADDANAKLVDYNYTVTDPRNYFFSYKTSNGIIFGEEGTYEETGLTEGYPIKRGLYSYLTPDNVRHTITYIADDKGYQPKFHKSFNLKESNSDQSFMVDVDDDRIGSALLATLSGQGIG